MTHTHARTHRASSNKKKYILIYLPDVALLRPQYLAEKLH
jgi:hypothetical protein